MPEYVLDIETRAGGNASQHLGRLGQSLGGLGGLAKGVAVGGLAVIGGAITGIGVSSFNTAKEVDKATKQIGASLGKSTGELSGYAATIKDVWGDNFGDSIAEVGRAVEETSRQLQLAGDDPALAKLTKKAFAVKDVFEKDVNETVNAAKVLMDEFGLSGDQAFDFIAKGLQEGLDSSGDFLDSVREYGVQFGDARFDAGQFFSILQSGLRGGVLGTDKVADAVKEMTVRLTEGGDDVHMAFNAIGLDFDQIEASVRSGDESWGDYFSSIVSGLNDIEDPVERRRQQIAIFGSMAEDLGGQFTEGLSDAMTSLADMEGAADSLNQKYDTLPEAFEGIGRKLGLAFSPLGETLLGLINTSLPTLSTTAEGMAAFVSQKIETLRTAWEEDWGGIRTAATTALSDIQTASETFWQEYNRTFNKGGEQNQQSWAGWIAAAEERLGGFGVYLLTQGTEFLRLWRNTQQLWLGLTSGDWSTVLSAIRGNFDGWADVMLNIIEVTFGPGMRNQIAQVLNDTWDLFTGWGTQLSEWWTNFWSAFQLPSWLTGETPLTPNIQVPSAPAPVQPEPVPETPGFTPGPPPGWVGPWNPRIGTGLNPPGGVSSINVYITGATNPTNVRRDAEIGVRAALRAAGMAA